MALWTDIVDPATLTGYVRSALSDIEKRKGNLARFLSPLAITGLVVVLFALLVAYNVFAKNKPASGNAQENPGAKS